MTEVAVVPAWVVPPPGQVRDAHCIAAVLGEREIRPRGVFAAIDWVTGGEPAPITRRRDALTPAVVRGEMMLADLLAAGRPGRLAPDMWAHLGVAGVAAEVTDRDLASGVAPALAWLLGAQRRAPVDLPRRNPDGSPLSAEQLYEEARAARHFLEPEDRARLRTDADRLAARYRRLTDLVTAVLA